MKTQQYIIDLAYRYKEGKVSKKMIGKYLECAIDCIAFEMHSKKDITPWEIIAGCSSILQAAMVVYQPKLKRVVSQDFAKAVNYLRTTLSQCQKLVN